MFSTCRPKRALFSYVYSGISKNSSLLTIWLKKKNLLNTRSNSIIIEDSKVNKKNQMKVLNNGNVESLCTTRCRRVWWYMIMNIKLSATNNAKQCCHQRKPKEFHNCWTSNSAEDNKQISEFWCFPVIRNLSKLNKYIYSNTLSKNW